MRAIFATLLARRVRDFRKPRRALSAQEFVMRVIGLNTMLELIYELIAGAPEPDDASSRYGRAYRRGEKSGLPAPRVAALQKAATIR